MAEEKKVTLKNKSDGRLMQLTPFEFDKLKELGYARNWKVVSDAEFTAIEVANAISVDKVFNFIKTAPANPEPTKKTIEKKVIIKKQIKK
jgi:hypothetical protein